MSGPVVFAFAVADGLVPVPGAAPYEVLARQLPRLLVARLNAVVDRGARFFPFLGLLEGKRDFLRPSSLLEPGVLASVHKQSDVSLLVDGIVRGSTLHWRLIDAASRNVRMTIDVPFDPRTPLAVLPRLEFEIADQLGWEGRPQPVTRLQGETLGWYLVLKDELLRREANLPETAGDPLRAARRCTALAAADVDVQDLVFDFVAHLLRRGERREECAAVLAPLAALVSAVERLERLDALLLAAGDAATAATVACRAATQRPERPELVERAAAQAFKLGRYDDVRAVVENARRLGVASPAALAQLAAACDRTEDREARGALVRELVGMDDLPVAVARLVASFLIEEDQPSLACAIVGKALQKEPTNAMLHFEFGRACMLLDDVGRAHTAFAQALQLGLSPVVAVQARRFARLTGVSGLWTGMQRVEQAIARSDLADASSAARTLAKVAAGAAESWYLLGLVEHKRGRLRRAERLLRRALRLDDTSADAHNRLGILLVETGRVADGHGQLQRAHALAPNDAAPLLHLAQACALLGRRVEAEAHIVAAEQRGAAAQLVAAVRREILAKPA